MLPFIAVGLVAGVGIAIYKKYNNSQDKAVPVAAVSIGKFAIWGRPNAGKTTFINRLLGKTTDSQRKEATTAKTVYKDIPFIKIAGADYKINEIVDMPGTQDRRGDWLELVKSHEHVFYLLNLARTDSPYMSEVRKDLSETVRALRASGKSIKRINIIASHVDESSWKNINPAEINNILQNDDDFRKLYETIDGVAGYVYAANLTDTENFQRLIESVVKDVIA
jgi:GTPase SAR1 family protein